MKKFNLDFYGKRNIFFGISIGIFIIGILCNIIFGSKLDIQFKGGAIVKYSYVGDVNEQDVEKLVSDVTGLSADVRISKNVIMANSSTPMNNLAITFSGTKSLNVDSQQKLTEQLTSKYPDAKMTLTESNSVDATMGHSFFLKCLIAIALAFILLLVYIAFRFQKIGGWSAGTMGIIALIHDVLMVYFTFTIFQFPINDNFIAVVLAILGYSLNDTIVIYDRIRENRKLMGPKTDIAVLVNTSINQTFSRSVNTSLWTFLAIATVAVVSLVFNLTSVASFALPMMVGVISGSYSSICIAGPLWVMWKKYQAKK
jgi:preprotein translocase subunit SecF